MLQSFLSAQIPLIREANRRARRYLLVAIGEYMRVT